MPTASLIKFPVMVEAYRQAAAGQLSLATPVVVRDEDKVPGSGILTTHFSAGATFSLRDAIRLMIAWSDNTATNLVVDRVGIASTSRFMKELGCPESLSARHVDRPRTQSAIRLGQHDSERDGPFARTLAPARIDRRRRQRRDAGPLAGVPRPYNAAERSSIHDPHRA
jgi:beta-lactamase class A